MIRLIFVFIVGLMTISACQSVGQTDKIITYTPDTAALGRAYDTYKEPTIKHRRFKHAHIEPLIVKRQGGGIFDVTQLGVSVLNKPIYQLKYGTGEKSIMLWSQMHGNEPTATMALLDLFNFLEGSHDGMDSIRNLLKENTSIYFIPMLNPDGADAYTRRNALDIDLNRDARAGSTVEGDILINAAKVNKPRYGFNLHDQHIYYNVPGTKNPVTISLLAPAYNEAREVNDVRGGAMKIATGISKLLYQYIPDAVAKYDDTYAARAFGDSFQSWGASTVLIESGGYAGDPEKQYIRKLNFVVILNALIEIAQGSYGQYDIADYESLPFNESRLTDVLLRNVTVVRDALTYETDFSIKRDEVTVDSAYYVRSRIDDVGDMQDNFGYADLDARGLTFTAGKIYPTTFDNLSSLSRGKAVDLLRQGYFAVRVGAAAKGSFHDLPLVVFTDREPYAGSPNLGTQANFFLNKDGKPRYAVVNGYLIDLVDPKEELYSNYVQ